MTALLSLIGLFCLIGFVFKGLTSNLSFIRQIVLGFTLVSFGILAFFSFKNSAMPAHESDFSQNQLKLFEYLNSLGGSTSYFLMFLGLLLIAFGIVSFLKYWRTKKNKTKTKVIPDYV